MDGHPWRKSVGESISVLPLTGGNRTFVNLKADYIRMTNAPTPGFMIEQVMKLSVVEEFDVTYFASFSPFHLREDQTDALLDDVQQRFDSADKKDAYFDYMKVYYDQLINFDSDKFITECLNYVYLISLTYQALFKYQYLLLIVAHKYASGYKVNFAGRTNLSRIVMSSIFKVIVVSVNKCLLDISAADAANRYSHRAWLWQVST